MNFVEYQKSKGTYVNKLWQELSHMSINTGLDLKTRLVWETKKHNNKWNIIYFGAMFFEVRGRILLRVKIFKVPSLTFVSWYLLKSWWKN